MLGYGYSALGSLFGKGATAAGMGNIAGKGLWGASMRAYSLALANPAAQRAVAGAAIGGIYGGISDNTTVLGGMGAGAAIGGASAPLGRGLRGGISAYRAARAGGQAGFGVGRGAALGDAFRSMGRSAHGYVGQSYSKAVNQFKAMRSSARERYSAATAHL